MRIASKFLAVATITLVAAALTEPIAAQGQTNRIDMKSVSFAPAQVTARAGDILEWNNSDIVAHTATSKEGGFDVNVVPGQKGSTVVKGSGTFDYICRYHPNMTGQIVVQP